VQMVEVAEELVEAMRRRQELILVAQVVLAELAGHVPERLEQVGDRRIFRAQTEIGAGHAHLRQPSSNRILARDESSAAGGATLLPVVIRKGHAFIRYSVNVGRPIAHLTTVVVADVPPANIISPEDEDVRLVLLSHSVLLFS